ncbi:MAG: AAA family ATPase [Eubacteriales bacterium]
MTLVSCYITNFGKLSNYTHQFTDGVNVVHHENGWGKTTFAAFLKAMLFGMDHGRKQDLDRNTYTPWNQGVFGGNLVFTHNKHPYKVERTFGKTAKEDTYTLIDLTTNSSCDHFSTLLGEEILEVDRDSFEKTAFLSLGENHLLTDIIATRLGDLDAQAADMAASSDAISYLESLASKLKGKQRGSGQISKLEANHALLRDEIETAKKRQAELEGFTRELASKTQELTELEQEISAEEARSVQGAVFKQLSLSLTKSQEECQEIEGFFCGNDVSKSQIDEMEHRISRCRELYHKIEDCTISDQDISIFYELEEHFHNGVPSHEQLNLMEGNLKKIRALEQSQGGIDPNEEKELAELTPLFREITLAKISACGKAYNRVHELTFEEIRLEGAAEKKGLPTILLSILLGIIGVALYFTPYFYDLGLPFEARISAAVCGGLFFLLAMILFAQKISKQKDKKEKKIQLEAVQLEKQKKNQEYNTFLSQFPPSSLAISMQLDQLREQLARFQLLSQQKQWSDEQNNVTKEEISFLLGVMNDFFSKYFPANDDSLEERLAQASESLAFYNKCAILVEQSKQAQQELDPITQILRDFFGKFNLDNPENYEDSIVTIRENMAIFEEKRAVLEQCLGALKDFQEKNPTYSADQGGSTSQLREKAQSIAGEIATQKKDIDLLYQEADGLSDLLAELSTIEIKIAELTMKHQQLSIAISSMYTAKETLAQRYLKKMSGAFQRIVAQLELKETLHIDTSLAITTEEDGFRRDFVSQSQGKQDLYQIITRLALVEAVYQNLPPLVLDDPFSHLDDQTLFLTCKLIAEMGEKFQVIYFVCHESRA